MRMARLRHGTLPASFARGRFRGNQPQALHEWSGSIAARQGAECGHRGDGHKAWPPPQGRKGFDSWGDAPRVALFLECVLPTLKALPVVVDRAPVCLANDGVRRCGPEHFREPAEMGRLPGGPAGVAESMPQQKGCAPQWRCLAIADGLFPRPAEVADGFRLHRGAIHRGEGPRACPPRHVPGGPAVRFDAVPGLLGPQRWRHDPAGVVFLRALALAPVPTGAGFREQDQGRGRGLPLANPLSAVTLAWAHSPARGHRGALLLRHRGPREGLGVALHAHKACVRLGQG